MLTVEVRPELDADLPAVRRVNELAFGRDAEADLVDRLRDAGALSLSLVATLADEVAGHCAFSPVTLESDEGDVSGLGLGPMAVVPTRQRTHIGSALVQRGLDELRKAGHAFVVVLGHPDFYPRFGFARANLFALRCEFRVAQEAFMAIELQSGALPRHGGIVRYRPEFGAL